MFSKEEKKQFPSKVNSRSKCRHPRRSRNYSSRCRNKDHHRPPTPDPGPSTRSLFHHRGSGGLCVLGKAPSAGARVTGVPIIQGHPTPGPSTGSPLHHRGSGVLGPGAPLWCERDPVLGPELWGSASYKEPCKSGPRNGSPLHYTGTPVTLAPALDPPPPLYQAPNS